MTQQLHVAGLQQAIEDGYFDGSGYGYGTVPGRRWAIDTEGGHVVVSVSLIRNGYEYGIPDRRGTIFIRKARGKFIPV